jgi:hypothetical protein
VAAVAASWDRVAASRVPSASTQRSRAFVARSTSDGGAASSPSIAAAVRSACSRVRRASAAELPLALLLAEPRLKLERDVLPPCSLEPFPLRFISLIPAALAPPPSAPYSPPPDRLLADDDGDGSSLAGLPAVEPGVPGASAGCESAS